MKKIIAILTVLCLLVALCGCIEVREETGRKAIDCRYTESYNDVVTDYQHKYSFLKGGFVLMPNVHTVTRPEKYEVLYQISYNNGTTEERWETVDKETYVSFKGGVQE